MLGAAEAGSVVPEADVPGTSVAAAVVVIVSKAELVLRVQRSERHCLSCCCSDSALPTEFLAGAG